MSKCIVKDYPKPKLYQIARLACCSDASVLICRDLLSSILVGVYIMCHFCCLLDKKKKKKKKKRKGRRKSLNYA
jgi:hypothetical protein